MTSYYQQSDNKLPNSSSDPDLIERNDHWLPHLLKTHNRDNTLKLCLSPSPATSRRTLPPSFLGVNISLGLQLCGKPSTAHAQLHQVHTALNLEHCPAGDVGNSSTFPSTHSHKPTVSMAQPFRSPTCPPGPHRSPHDRALRGGSGDIRRQISCARIRGRPSPSATLRHRVAPLQKQRGRRL